MDGRTNGSGQRRRVRTGRHDRRLNVALDARLDERLRKAEKYGYAVAVIARDAIGQGLELTERTLDRELGYRPQLGPRPREDTGQGTLWNENGKEEGKEG